MTYTHPVATPEYCDILPPIDESILDEIETEEDADPPQEAGKDVNKEGVPV